MDNNMQTAQQVIENRLTGAMRGEPSAYFDLGIIFATGSDEMDVDLIQAHKWFNLAALGGNDEARQCRAEIAEEMNYEQIAQAQRQARSWLDAMADIKWKAA